MAIDENALQLLLGAGLPDSLPASLDLDSDILAPAPAGLPSQLLERRPDIIAAEHKLRAANADIGAARAAFFPRISLTGSAGSASAAMSGLFEAGSAMWQFMPQITLPIFNAGRLQASLDAARIRKDINIAQYEKAIQTAFREVADSLAARGTFGRQLDAQRDLVKHTGDYARLAQQRYDAGVDSYLTVLDARRQSFRARQQLIQDRREQLAGEVSLYKALGGGWASQAGGQKAG